ncbi:MAG: NAD(P)-dependent oxidoreductase [Oscillospiraceae bacterium]
MKIGIIGATGKAGGLILKEALGRNLDVTAIVRNGKKLTDNKVPFIEKDLFSLTKVDLAVFEVVVDAFSSPLNAVHLHLESIKHLAGLVSGTKTRLIAIGGAGSLYVDEEKTVQFKDTDMFPAEFKPLSTAGANSLNYLKATQNLHWTVISPPVQFEFEGEKTGNYVITGEVLTKSENGKSRISYADYAIALVDEIINSKYDKQRIGVRD